MGRRIERARQEEGFTLIELLVVVIIIGILAAIAIPIFLNQRQRAWQGSAESDVRNAAIQVETEATRDGTYSAPASATVQTSAGVTVLYRPLDASGATEGTDGDELHFQLCAEHVKLLEQSVVYDSLNGGVQPFNEGPSESCTDISADFGALP